MAYLVNYGQGIGGNNLVLALQSSEAIAVAGDPSTTNSPIVSDICHTSSILANTSDDN